MTTDEIMRLAETYRSAWGAYMCGSSPTAGNGMDAAHAALKAAVDTLVAERDALKAALEQVTESLDRLGDQSDGEVSPRVWTKYECQASIDAARAALKGKP